MSKVKFNHLTQCANCLKANLTKSSDGHHSLHDSLTTPYQGLYVDLGFLGCISKDKEGNIIESSHVHIEGFNGEQSWILISDGRTRMLYIDTCLSKYSPLI